MSSDVIQAKYDELETIARQFGQRAQAIGELRSRLQRAAQPLEQGGWQGRGAAAFFGELNAQLVPATQHLRQALEEARAVTLEASAIMRRAEQEASAPFRGAAVAGTNTGGGAPAFADAAASAASSAESGGFLGGVGDFFGGMWAETKDMASGLKNLVLHPIDTAKGLAHAVMNPGEFWNAFKQPYVEAWESGHPWEAVGRGTMFALSFALGAKGVDKVGKAAGAAGKVGRAGEVAGAAGRAGEAAGAAGRVGEAGTLAQVAQRTGAFVEGIGAGEGLGKLAGRNFNVSRKGLNIVEQHLKQFGSVPENVAMIERLRSALSKGAKIEGADASFYLHELNESTRMSRLIKQGMAFEEAYEIAHPAALRKYNVSPFSVYHPDVIKSLPGHFNPNWYKFWNIEGP